jgi:hypothetical protein
MPEITPSVLSCRPEGKEPPETDQMYGPVPPDADSVAEYGLPTDAGATACVDTRSCDGRTERVNVAVCVSVIGALESLTWTVKAPEVATAGVPVMVPSEKTNPAGRLPETRDHVYGGRPPDATRDTP